MIESLRLTFSLGPFNLPWAVIPLLSSWLVYRISLGRLYVNRKETLQNIDGILFNGLFIFIIGWKLSPLLFQFETVIQNPLAVLYLPGGTGGFLLGGAAALIYGTVALLKRKTDRRTLLKGIGLNGGYLLLLALVFGLGTGFLVKQLTPRGMQSAPVQGSEAPDFLLEAEDGLIYNLSDYAGRVVVLNFWASWCPPCKAELPELKSFYEGLNPDEVVFLSINLYTSENNPAVLPEFIKDEGILFPVLYDRSGEVAEAYAVESIPTTVLIDRGGQIKAVRIGAVTEALLKRLISDVN